MEINNAVDARREGINTEPVLDRAAGLANKEQTPVTEESVQAAIAQAKTACQTIGNYSSECATAWDNVEEMQAAQSDRHGQDTSKNALERYCQERPSADECRIYDV